MLTLFEVLPSAGKVRMHSKNRGDIQTPVISFYVLSRFLIIF